MTKRMLIDATHDEETRVVVMDNDRLVEFDYESKFRKPMKGSVFLAKVTRVEPSLQAAFVNFGGNRHGFLPFSEIHPDYFRIPISDREALMAEQQAEIDAFEKQEQEEERERAREEGKSKSQDDDAADQDDLDAAEEVLDEAIEDEEDNPEDQIGNVKEADIEDEELSEEEDQVGNVKSDDSSDEDGNNDHRGNRGRRGGRGGRGRGHNNRGRGGKGGGRGGKGRQSYRGKRTEVYDDAEPKGFRFNLRRKYKIQEVIKRGQIMLVQVSKEERGNKGAAVTSYLSLPGRYSVLMPNSPRAGGVSRKISSFKDRSRMKEILNELEIPSGMSVIMRTAGVSRTKTEIKRDLDYLMRLWNNIREGTLESSAPAVIYEEADLIQRAVRDIYTREMEEVIVAGDEGYKNAKNFMKMMIPSHGKRVKEYKDEDVPLLNKYHAETEIADIGKTQVTLPSGGYLVINPTEALVSVDVNSGKATKERHIEETALNTNMEAAVEVARQLRLRDLGGLVVVDFIDMEDRRNNNKVERKMREVLSQDRARTQNTRISMFGLMEISRQRMNPSLTESQFEMCPECQGMGRVRSADATSIMVLRAIEDEGIKKRAAQVMVHTSNAVALYILNNKRKNLSILEERYGFSVEIRVDHTAGASEFRVEVSRPLSKDQDNDDDTHGENNDDNRRSRGRGRRGGRNRGNNDQQRNRRSNKNDQDVSLADQLNDDDSDDQSKDDTSFEAKNEPEDKQDDKPKRGRKPAAKSSKLASKTDDKADKEDAKPEGEKSEDKPKRGRKPAAKKSSEKKEEPGETKDTAKDEDKDAKKSKPTKSRSTKKSKDEESAEEAPVNDDKPNPAKDHEVVNEQPEKKKKGWWSR